MGSNKVGRQERPKARLYIGDKEVAGFQCAEANTAGVALAIRRLGHERIDESGKLPAYLLS